MKRIIKLTLLVLSFLLPTTATAYNFMLDGIYYNINGNEVSVTYKNRDYYNTYSGAVTIPAIVTYNGSTYSVTSIGDRAFYGCSGLTSVTIPNSVTSIGDRAFYGCSDLTSLTIPNSVTSIGGSAFSGTAWYKNQPDGLVYAGLVAYKYKGTMPQGTQINITNGTRGIAGSAFYGCYRLTSVNIPNSVTSIGDYAFFECSGLTSVTFPNSVTSIGDCAFYGCSGLTSVTFPNSVTSIGGSAFSGTAWYDNQPDGLVYAGLVAYKYKGTMPQGTQINITNGTRGIAGSAFYGCSGLTSVTIPNSVTSIGSNPFSGCSGLTSVKVASGNTIYDSRGNCNAIIETASNTVIVGCKNTVIPNSVISIGDYAFSGCSELTSVAIPNSVTSIGYCAFSNCSSLTSVTIPNSVTSIGDHAFSGCSELTSVAIPNSVTSIGYSAFSGCSELTSVTIPNSVTYIGYSAFYGCSGLTSVTIPNSVTSIGGSAFSGCSELTSVTIPNSVTYIGYSAFYGCSGLTSVTIPNSVTSIGDCAFQGCSGLTSVTIGSSVATIGGSAFQGCTSLNTLNFNAVECDDFSSSASYRPFNDLNISIINIGESVQKIPAYFAYYFTKLRSVTIPNSVTSMGDYAFYGCSGLTSVTIGNSVTSIGKEAFNNAPAIEAVTCKAEMPPSWNDLAMFTTNVYNHSPLYVPTGSVRAYQADQCWGQFINIIGKGMNDDVLATSISLNQSQMSLQVGSTLQLTATVLPDSTTNKVVNWVSSDENVATVDTTGLMTAIAVGSATITATTTDGSNLNASCVVTVTEDLSNYDNYLSMSDTAAFHGDTIVIPVKMTNNTSIISFQTDIFLPEGLELMQEDGEYMIDPSSRMTRTHSIMSNDVSSGAIRVLCYSSNYKPFTGNSGDDLFYITVKVADDAEGDYIIQLKNTLLTNTDFVDIVAPDVAANVNVKSYLLGDANNSGTVTVTDVVVTAQYVLERNPQPFVFEAADVNFDNNITVADVSRIAWMVLNPTLNAPLRAPALWNNGDCMNGSDITLAAGETRRVSIMLDNEMDYSAFQLDLNLPAGLTASNFQLSDRAGSHAFDVNTLQNDNIRALCYSPDMTAINGHEGALLTFDVTATGYVKGDIIVDGIELVTTACQSVCLDAFTISVNNPSSFNEVVAGKTVAKVEYFNLAGQQIEQPESGITLVVTTYTDGTRSTSKIIR